MAAYQVLQLFLLQQQRFDDCVVVSPYIYFEALEQLHSFPHLRIVHASEFTAESIINTAEANNAKAVFFDPVANVADLPTVDVWQSLTTVSCKSSWSDRYILIDGTLASVAMSPYDWHLGIDKVKLVVLYYESFSKYLSMGLDLQMEGLLVYPSELDETMRTIRRNSGTVMYSRGATLVPGMDHSVFQSRMSLLGEHAKFCYRVLHSTLKAVALVRYPEEWRARHDKISRGRSEQS